MTNFSANTTMMQIGHMAVPDATQARMAEDIVRGMNLPLTSENLLLASYGISGGRILQKRYDRQRKHSGRQ